MYIPELAIVDVGAWVVGAMVGGTVGATVGAVVGGTVGAVVGATIGACLVHLVLLTVGTHQPW